MIQAHVAVFGSSQAQPGEPAYSETERLGARLASFGVAVVNGGYSGLMEAVSKGAATEGGRVIGITSPQVFPQRSGANAWITEERPHSTITERIHDIVNFSDASITMTGSLGTLTELMAAWNTAFVARFRGAVPKPVITIGEPWTSLVPHLAETLDTDRSVVTTVASVDEAVDELVRQLELSPVG